jgi:hypothetical protein
VKEESRCRLRANGISEGEPIPDRLGFSFCGSINGMACDERFRLIAEFEGAVRAYSITVKQRADSKGPTSRKRYLELMKYMENAQLECERARLDLESHTAKHNCLFSK